MFDELPSSVHIAQHEHALVKVRPLSEPSAFITPLSIAVASNTLNHLNFTRRLKLPPTPLAVSTATCALAPAMALFTGALHAATTLILNAPCRKCF
jgi:hypothetical protein